VSIPVSIPVSVPVSVGVSVPSSSGSAGVRRHARQCRRKPLQQLTLCAASLVCAQSASTVPKSCASASSATSAFRCRFCHSTANQKGRIRGWRILEFLRARAPDGLISNFHPHSLQQRSCNLLDGYREHGIMKQSLGVHRDSQRYLILKSWTISRVSTVTWGDTAWKPHMCTHAFPVRMVRNDFMTPGGKKNRNTKIADITESRGES